MPTSAMQLKGRIKNKSKESGAHPNVLLQTTRRGITGAAATIFSCIGESFLRNPRYTFV